MSQNHKPEPMIGMPVTWIDPNDDKENRTFIRSSLIGKIGKEGLEVLTAEKELDRWIVTLSKDGEAVKLDQTEKRALQINWHYLRPF